MMLGGFVVFVTTTPGAVVPAGEAAAGEAAVNSVMCGSQNKAFLKKCII
jgi:hypothetical protein